jgi:hypothetical protein
VSEETKWLAGIIQGVGEEALIESVLTIQHGELQAYCLAMVEMVGEGFSRQLSAVSRQPSAVSRQPSAIEEHRKG